MFHWSRRRTPLPDTVYRELVRMLFSMHLPVLGLGAAYVGIVWLLAARWDDPVLFALAGAGLVTVLLRLTVLIAFHRGDDLRSRAQLQRWERAYAIGSYAFAFLLGALNFWVLQYHYPMMHLLTVSLMFGFGAGVVSRISYRPVICVVSLALAVVPTVVALIIHSTTRHADSLHDELFAIEAGVVAMIALLSLNTVRFIYRAVIENLTARHDLTLLAKNDALTGLPNRLLLRERFDDSVRSLGRAHRILALHFLDLDGFKAVNDQHGHPAGDALLCEVARRLTRMVRTEDTVARIGGDEFVVVQTAIEHRGEAEMLARRIIRQLSLPYEINGEIMRISVSVGISLAPDQGVAFDRLSACADAALYRSKGEGKGRHHFCTPDEAQEILTEVA